MKKIPLKIKLIVALIALTCLPFLCHGQTTTNTPQGTFYDSVFGYFGSLNTNLPAVSTVQIWTGTANVRNQVLQAEFGGSLHPAVLGGFGVDAVLRNDVALGSLAAAQGGLSYHYILTDIDFAAFVHGGYDWHNAVGYVSPGLRALKMLTPNTYSGVSLELPVAFHGAAGLTPTYGILLGFKF